jgi:FAD/FMN-containing dehydrogenase
LPNLGDLKVQTVAGAIGTGTHGSGKHLPNLAATLIGGRLVTGTGKIVEFSAERDVDLGRAARVSLGALGVLTALRVKLEKVYRLRRREWCARTDDCPAHLQELIDENRNFDFYWYPRRDEAKLRMLNRPEHAVRDWPFAKLLDDYEGWSDEVLSKRRELRFEEMEYALPAEAGPDCFREVRKRMLERHRQNVGWRALYRTTAADDAFLSNANGRATVNISLHQNASLPYWGFFNDMEPIFRAHGGRPHWGKKHTLKAPELLELYPHWHDFLKVRSEMDPGGVFLSTPLRELLGVLQQ